MARSLLTGSPIKRIGSFALPLLIGNLFQQMYNLADAIVVGRYINSDAFAAVGATGAINFMVLGFVLGVCAGFSVPIAQDFGAGDMRGVRKNVANCIYWSIIITVIMTALMAFFTDDVLRLLNTPEDIFDASFSYIYIIFLGMFSLVLYNVLAAILRALGESRTPLYFLVIACVINVVLDITFIAALKMGVEGAAYATVIAQLISGLLCLVYISKKFPILRMEKGDMQFDWAYGKRLLSSGIPMGLQSAITAIGSVVLQSAVNGLGTMAVTAISAGSRVQNILAAPMDTMGIAMATFCGQNYGARQIPRIKQGMKQVTLVAMIYTVIAFLLAFFFGRGLIEIVFSIQDSTVLDMSRQFLIMNAACYPALACIFIYRSSLQGLGYSSLAMFAGVCEMIARLLVVWLLIPPFGFTGACFANPLAWVAASAMLVPVFIYELKKMLRFYEAQQRVLTEEQIMP